MTLSCKVGLMRLRPKWPWSGRRYKIAPDESGQYWYLFLFPPPLAMLFFHFSSEQWWQYKKCFWRLSLILQNSIAPSLSRCKLPWRRKWINFFDTSQSESEYFPGSTSVHVLFQIGVCLGEEPAGSLLCGFALASDRLAKARAFDFDAQSSNCISDVSCSLLFKFVTNLFKPWEILTHEWELSFFMDNSDFHSIITLQVAGCDFQYGPNFGVPFPLIQPFGSDVSSACVIRAPHRLSPSGLGEHLFHPKQTLSSMVSHLFGPIRFPQHLFSVHDHGRQRSERRSQPLSLPLRWPDWTSGRLRAEEYGRPVTQSIATPEPSSRTVSTLDRTLVAR